MSVPFDQRALADCLDKALPFTRVPARRFLEALIFRVASRLWETVKSREPRRFGQELGPGIHEDFNRALWDWGNPTMESGLCPSLSILTLKRGVNFGEFEGSIEGLGKLSVNVNSGELAADLEIAQYPFMNSITIAYLPARS
jgi:hypothetical protein